MGVLVLAVSLAVGLAGPARSQNLLGIHRVVCAGNLVITNPQTVVPTFEKRTVARPPGVAAGGRLEVKWSCNGAEKPVVRCPAETVKVTVDRTQGKRSVTFVCLRR